MENKVLEIMKEHIGQKIFTPSPVGRWLDGRLLHAEEGELIFEFEVREEMSNPVGILHGGMIAAIADEVLGAAIYSCDLPFIYSTINLSVDMLRPASRGQKVDAHAKIVRKGRRIVHAVFELKSKEGKLLATATSNFVVSDVPTAPMKEAMAMMFKEWKLKQ